MIHSYIALDLETTGLNPAEDRILEIGAVRVEDGKITGTYDTLIRTGVPIAAKIQELTGITEEMAESGRDIREVMEEFIPFCKELPLLGHNIMFDYSFVKQNAVNLGLTFEKQGVDTLKIARKLLPPEESKSLTALCAYYGISREREHRASDDAQAAMELYGILGREFPDCPQEVFEALPLNFKAKRRGPITPAQKGYLNDLIKYHKIALEISVDSLTKNEASRLIDKIISSYGRIIR